MNPLQQPVGKPNNATNIQNIDTPSVPKTHNPFNLTRQHLTTEQFGTYNPFRCIQVAIGDHLPIGVTHEVMSETLKSPLFSELHKKHDYFYVPMQAIMPNTWDYIYRNPSQGDDVPDDVNCIINDFPSYCRRMLLNTLCFANTRSSSLTIANLDEYFRYIIMVEEMISCGSILSRLGYNLNFDVIIGASEGSPFNLTNASVDDFYDVLYNVLLDKLYIQVNYGTSGVSRYYTTDPDNDFSQFKLVTKSVMISIIRNNTDNVLYPSSFNGDWLTATRKAFSLITNYTFTNATSSPSISPTLSEETRTLNISSLIAYNLCCAQYFVNPKVDFIYNSELYLQTMKSLLLDANIITTSNMMFPINGHSISYDVFSNIYLQSVFEEFNITDYPAFITNLTQTKFKTICNFVRNIFAPQTSLYYADYFTGARPTPIGIGDSDYTVTGSTIDMVMLARKQMLAKYLYTVGRIGNDAQSQREIISGSYGTPDFHFPQYIGSSDSLVTGFQVGNTTPEGQGNQVTRLNSSDNTFDTTLDISQHGYVLCISSFYMPRSYCKTKDRHFFQRDRFDIFNEMLQFGGDQPLWQAERNDFVNGTFGYHSSNEEYKQTFPQASGAFKDILASWGYVVDADTIYTSDNAQIDVISPSSIRVLPSEFDVFMQSMSYLSLGHNFHFIVKYSVNCIANRQMLSNPDIF